MKNKLLLIILILLTLLSGCTQNKIAEENIITKENEIDTLFYTIDDVDENIIYKIFNEEDENYILTFYDKVSNDEFGGGRLFSVEIFDFEEDYTFLPSYKLLGYIITENGVKYNVVITYPTDVQFMPNTVESYKNAEQSIPEIIGKIVFKESVEFILQ